MNDPANPWRSLAWLVFALLVPASTTQAATTATLIPGDCEQASCAELVARRQAALSSSPGTLEINTITIDRQTGMAVHLSEQIAAKTALQEAMAVLAERIVPKAVK